MNEEQNVIMLIGHIPCFMLNKVTLYHVLEVTIVLLEVHLDTALHVVCRAAWYHAGVLPDFACNLHCLCPVVLYSDVLNLNIRFLVYTVVFECVILFIVHNTDISRMMFRPV
jgi:hypothetical protein